MIRILINFQKWIEILYSILCIINNYSRFLTNLLKYFTMTISKNDIKKIAYLARIKISQEESILLEKKLTSIIDLIDEMQKVNTDGVEPMSHALDVNQPLRKDNITELDLRKKTMPLAPEVDKSLFIVPQVIE